MNRTAVTPLLDGLAPITAFPTVDELRELITKLAADNPTVATVRDVGASRNGDAIQLLSIVPPSARVSVLVVGQPHPNEPIGMATIIALASRLVDPAVLEATEAAWHFIPCVDPDGTRLNEGWFQGPWTREHYARNFYRPAADTQVEWTFPFSTGDFSVNAPMPETIALMAAIDHVKPQVLSSLHNGELGGAYFYATAGAPELYPQLTDLCAEHGIPLHLGDPETPLSEVFVPAVYSVPTAQQIFDMATALGADPADLISGGNSLDYAERHGPVTGVVVELPYWRDDRAADISDDPSGESRRVITLRTLDLQQQDVAQLRALYDATPDLPVTPFSEAVDGFLTMDESGWIEGQRQAALTDPEFEKPATVAEVFSTMDNVHMFRLRLGGMLLRALPADAPTHEAAERLFTTWCAEAAADNRAQPIPIADLVAVQAGSILAVTAHALSKL